MEKIKEFIKYSNNLEPDKYANEVHIHSETILKKIVNEKNIKNFRNNDLTYYSGSLSHPDKFIGYWFSRGIIRNYLASIRYLYFEKKKIKKFLSKQKLKFFDIKENRIGNPILFKFFLFSETGTNISNCFYFSLFKKYIDQVKAKKIIEIGGGFGKLASIILKNYPKVNYNLIELPYTSVTSYYYLKEFSKLNNLENVSFFFNPRKKFDIQNQISVLTNTYVHSNENLFPNTDLLINTQSFMHMSQKEILFYIDFIKKNKIKFILTLNRLERKRKEENEFDKLFTNENIKLIDKIDLRSVLEDMYLTFYENLS